MGARVMTDNVHEYELTASDIHTLQAPYELVKTMRASILVLGPTLARFGEDQCVAAGRLRDWQPAGGSAHQGLAAMGADIVIEHGYVKGAASSRRARGDGHGHRHRHRKPADGRHLAEGVTILENAAREPEVTDLAECLVKMGARSAASAATAW